MTYAGADSEFGIACESATPSDAKQTTPSATNTTSANQSCGQATPEEQLAGDDHDARPAATVLVTALPAIPAR